jgi:hypothetical protein
LNSYGYAQNNPIRFLDPLGTSINDFAGPSGAENQIGSYRGVDIFGNGGDPVNTHYQCTEFVDRFAATNWNISTSNFTGNAKDYVASEMNAQLGSGSQIFVTSYNGQAGNSLPTEDSIITFGPKGTVPEGHVAVIGAVDFDTKTKKGNIWIAQQNTDARVYKQSLALTQNSNGAYTIANFSNMPVIGWTNKASQNASPQGGSGGSASSRPGFLSALVSILQRTVSILSAMVFGKR